jgi:hypothetical protein
MQPACREEIMYSDNIFHKLLSTVNVLGRNAIPLGLVWFAGYSSGTGMALYFLETFLAVMLAALYILLRAPKEDPGYHAIASSRSQTISNGHVSVQYDPGSRKSLLQGYLLFCFGFAFIPGLFFLFWIFALHANISRAAILNGLAGIAFFQVLGFLADFFLVGRLTPERAGAFLNDSMGRAALIYLAVFAGMILGLLVSIQWFIYPFAVLKAMREIVPLFHKSAAPLNLSEPDDGN